MFAEGLILHLYASSRTEGLRGRPPLPVPSPAGITFSSHSVAVEARVNVGGGLGVVVVKSLEYLARSSSALEVVVLLEEDEFT